MVTGGDSGDGERSPGQFFHVGSTLESSASRGAEMHPLGMWVLDSGAAWTMTPRKDLLDKVGPAPIPEVHSASGHSLKVMGAGRAVLRGADGKPVVLRDVLLVPDLKANLISLRKLAKQGVSTCTDGPHTFTAMQGSRVLWELHQSKDLHQSMWQLPAFPWSSAMGRGVFCGWRRGSECFFAVRGNRLGDCSPSSWAHCYALTAAAGEAGSSGGFEADRTAPIQQLCDLPCEQVH